MVFGEEWVDYVFFGEELFCGVRVVIVGEEGCDVFFFLEKSYLACWRRVI